MAESVQASAYIPEEDRDRWKQRADEMDMTFSEWMYGMVEAGMKKFDRSAVEPDETKSVLREQRSDLQQELDRTRERVKELELQRNRGERGAISDYVSENPGAEYRDILQYVMNTSSGRVTSLLDSMEGDEIEMTAGRYYTRGGD